MPFEYAIDKSQRLTHVKATGKLTAPEARRFQEALRADSDFDPSFDSILDLTEVTSIDVSADEIRALATRNPSYYSSRFAIVAPQPVVFGMARMLQSYNESSATAWNAAVFHDLVSAMAFVRSGKK